MGNIGERNTLICAIILKLEIEDLQMVKVRILIEG